MTTKTYDGQTARFLASVATCMPPLSGEIMQGWVDNPQGLKKFLGGLNPPTIEAASRKVLAALLEETGDPVEFSAVARFIARDKLVVDTNGELPISYLGDNLKANFLDVIEENVPATTLKQRKLLRASVDRPILAALGDKDLAKIEKARVALAHVYDFLKTADRKRWYVFYAADAKGVVWAVRALWLDDGWLIEALSVSDPHEWNADHHVVSR